MLKDSDVEAARIFLNTAKREIKNGNRIFIYRSNIEYDGKIVDSHQALLDLDIVNINQLWNYVLCLEEGQCFNISKDHDYKRDNNDDMYEFIMYINQIKVYIKLTLNNRGTICLSFHKSRY